MCLSLVMVVMGVSGLNTAIPSIQRDLNATATDLQWIFDSYAIVFAGLLLTAGALGDRFGRKRALMFGLAVFGHRRGHRHVRQHLDGRHRQPERDGVGRGIRDAVDAVAVDVDLPPARAPQGDRAVGRVSRVPVARSAR